MGNPRVHEIASDLGVSSQVVMDELKVMGHFLKGPSSSVSPPVARKVRARLAANVIEPPSVKVLDSGSGLQFDSCSVCGERHVLQRNGAMSIHATRDGARCEGSGTAYVRPPTDKPSTPPAKVPKDVEKRSASKHLVDPLDPEWQAAFDAAAHREDQRVAAKFDRRIYAVKGVQQIVRGGDVGHGKRS